MVNEQRIESDNPSEGGEYKKTPESIEEIKAETDKVLGRLETEGVKDVYAVESAGGTPEECEEMQTNAEKTNERAGEAREEYLKESKKEKNIPRDPEETIDIETFKAVKAAEEEYEKKTGEEKEVQMEQTVGFVKKNYAKIEGTTLKIFRKLGMEDMSADTIKETMIDELVKALENKALLEGLKEDGIISEDEAATIFMIAPIVKNAVETSRGEGGDIIKSIFKDSERNLQYIATAGVLLEKLSESNKISDPEVKLIVKSLSKVLQNETFQKFLSELVAQPNEEGEEIVERN